jgi:regulator of protease activity HflC (stomatin/prohibitin superfamily)
MSNYRMPGMPGSGDDAVRGPRRPPPPPTINLGMWGSLGLLLVLLLAGALIYVWFFVRIVVGGGEVLVLLKKNGAHSLPGDQVVVPAPPDKEADPQAHARWREQFEDVNGILEQVYKPGTYFKFDPIRYEREVVKVVEVPGNKVGIVIRKFGEKLPPGQVLAQQGQRGPLPLLLQPGRYPDYSNQYAYEVQLVDPIHVDPGHRGVVTMMAGRLAGNPNEFLVNPGEQGTQPNTEPEGFIYVNPFEKRIIPINTRSQRFEMIGADAIRFPSADSFEIRLEGFVEWKIDPARLPRTYVEYAEGSELIPFLEKQVILPYSRSFCRIVGSQYTARDFIAGETKLKFQKEFFDRLRERCSSEGIEISQALVRDIVPPDAIKNPINEREIARQQIRALEQQIQVAHSQADLARQTEMANQNQKIGEANKQVVTIIKQAEQERDVAVTRARQELEVARLRLEAAQKQADALVARGQAEAAVILLNKQAEAEPLRQQVAAFGDGHAFAQYFFNQKIAPSIKTILTNTDGVFGDIFRQFTTPAPVRPTMPERITEVQP